MMRALRDCIRQARQEEEGATTIVVVALAIALFAAAALAVDYSSLTMERQRLYDHVDAAAHAGAFELPNNGANAARVARDMALSMDDSLDPDIDLWCVVASVDGQPDADQIPATCDPGGTAPWPNARCNDVICAIPCNGTIAVCNAVRVEENKPVPFGFARVLGINQGDTGAVTTLACRGSCGTETPNPMDIVFMADRTRSMREPDRIAMRDAILASLRTMTPDMHSVAFGTLHKSVAGGWGCRTTASTASDPTAGTWVPLGYSNNYLTAAEEPTLNTADPLVNGIACLPESPSHGTNLAAAFKGAARYLLTAPSRPGRPGTVRRVLIFETDGMPDETIPTTTYQGLGNNTDFSAGSSGACYGGFYTSGPDRYWCSDWRHGNAGLRGCQNLERIAGEAKARGITVITVGFGEAATGGCNITNKYSTAMPQPGPPFRSGGQPVRQTLATAASPHPVTGEATTAGDCTTATGRQAENTDGDYFFCAVSGAEMADIFATAVAQMGEGIRFLKMP